MIEYLNPVSAHAELLRYNLSFDPAKPGRRFKVISNGFVDSENFRAILAERLAARFPLAEIEHWEREGQASYTEGDVEKLQGTDGAVLLWGH